MKKNRMYKGSKILFYLAVFFAPYNILFGVNFGLADVLLIFSAITLLLSGSDFTFPSRYILISLLFIMFGYCISIINAVYPAEAIKFPAQFIFVIFLVFPLTFTFIKSRRDLYESSLIILSSLVVTVSYGIYYYTVYGVRGARDRWTLFYNSPNLLATVLIFTIIIGIFTASYLYFTGSSKWGYVLLIISVLGVLLVIRTLSRRVLIFMTLAIVFSFLTRFATKNKVQDIATRFVVFCTLFTSIMYLFHYLGHIPEGLFIRLEETINYQDDTSTNTRILQHRIGLRSLSEYWLLGTGYNNFVAATNHAITLEEMSYMDQSYPRVHNAWFNPFIEGGIFAGIGIIMLFVKIIRDTIQTWLLGLQYNDLIAYGFAFSTSIYLLSTVFGTLSNLRFIWLMIAFSLVSLNIIKRK